MIFPKDLVFFSSRGSLITNRKFTLIHHCFCIIPPEDALFLLVNLQTIYLKQFQGQSFSSWVAYLVLKSLSLCLLGKLIIKYLSNYDILSTF